jgi:hypothetical protein
MLVFSFLPHLNKPFLTPL